MNGKKTLRKNYMALRAALDLPSQQGMLSAMLNNFREIDIPENSWVMSFKAMAEKNEVPSNIFEAWLKENSDPAGFCYPRADFATGEMEAYLDDEQITWENAAFGLYQPSAGNIISPAEIGVVLVPLLAFDEKGDRLGYGKGFYDRFLARCNREALKIGLSWFEAETAIPQIGFHDVSLDYCVTPQQLYVF